MLRFPRVYAITDTTISGLAHAEQVRRLADGGASLIQLREKNMSGEALYNEARAALVAAREHRVQLLINDRVDIALALGADGVHLGQDDLSPIAARELLGPNAIIGFSTHNLTQATEALKLPIDYVAIGPIFRTSTKRDTAPELGYEGLRQVRHAINGFLLVAIGGITHRNAPEVIEAGADSVAVINALLANSTEISTRVRSLIQIL